ncbi:uncharacterized protein LOC132270297 [Cornus florida]|uniref:uncharacterized protein LOC132270297 n=1 Tax=Cornus florida TaxID=4283 RepID=UPI0028A0C98D|nr:uncharacterized protein LOC132270297 [Cornus florida]
MASKALAGYQSAQLQVPYKKRFSGSSHDWLVTVEENFGLTIINPFSSATIQFPPIMDRSIFKAPKIDVEYFVTKVILSDDPTSSPNDYIATAIYGDCKTLAFIRVRDEAWTYIDKKRFQIISDVIYYEGQIFAVDYNGGILMIDVNRRAGESMAPQVEVIGPDTNVYSQPMYLVESSRSDLLLVYRFLEYDDDSQHTTSGFKVFKLLLDQFEQGWHKQVEVKSLDGDTLFLRDNHSICVSASKWPGCQANSICYTDDYTNIHFHPPSGRRDIGIYNMENGSFGTHYILDPSHKHMPPSIWIAPTTVFHKPLLSRI